MRLLNVHTHQFRDFYSIPENYIVTSHRWSAGNEAMLEDVKHGRRPDTSGFKKVQGFTKFVRENFPHINWLWIDTCCVNQESDREVSEAVNSMFRWYSQAELCLAYLPDVDNANDMGQFGRSEWFHRGWTLQELLAPRFVLFLTRDWEVIGCKGYPNERVTDRLNQSDVLDLEPAISNITAIPRCVLEDYATSKEYTIDTRLAWMTGRETTREEDIVYSLFGIFDVTLPVIYGETAQRAKRRLLREIAEVSVPQTSGEPYSKEARQESPDNSASQTLSADAFSGEESRNHAYVMPVALDNEHDLEGSDDDVLIFDFAMAACANGNDAFEHEDYYNAESQYQEACELIHKLPTGLQQQNRNILSKVEYRLAVCAFHIDNAMVAEHALSAVIQTEKCAPLELCDASHLLSQVFIKTGKLEQAATYCKNAYHRRRRILGKDSMPCLESLALLSRIHRLQADEREAVRYLSVIPKDMQSSMWETFSGLWPPVQLRWNGFKRLSRNSPCSEKQPRCLTFSHDSRLFAGVKEDAAVGLWDVASGTEIMRLTATPPPIRDIAISRDCKRVAAIVRKEVWLWNVNPEGGPAVNAFCQEYHPLRVVFSSDDRALVIGIYGADRQFWLIKDITSKTNLIRLERSSGCAVPAILPDGKRVVSASEDGTVSVWNAASLLELMTLRDEKEVTSLIEVSTNGKRLALLSGDNSIRLWDISTDCVRRLEFDCSNPSANAAFSTDLALFIHGDEVDVAGLRYLLSQSVATTFDKDLGTGIATAKLSPDAQVLAVTYRDGRTTLWSVASLLGQADQRLLSLWESVNANLSASTSVLRWTRQNASAYKNDRPGRESGSTQAGSKQARISSVDDRYAVSH